NHGPAYRAEHRRAAVHPAGHGHPERDRSRGGPVVPRARGTAAEPVLGLDPLRWLQLHLYGPVGGSVRVAGARDRQGRVPNVRRGAARGPRPAPKGGVTMAGVTAGDVALEIEDLAVEYQSRGSTIRVLPGVDLSLDRGEILGLVGESGSGKSTLALAILRLLPANARLPGRRGELDGGPHLT